MLRSLGITLAVLLCFAGSYFVLACAMQRSLLFPAPPANEHDALARIPGAERLWLDGDAARAEAWFLPAVPEAAGPAPLGRRD